MGAKHESLRQEFSLLFQNEFPDSRIFKRDVGLFYLPNGTPIRVGIDGMADSWAIIKIKEYLIHLEIEYKIDKDIQRKEQKQWQNTIESLGGIYLIIHNTKFTPQMAINKLKELLKC